MFNWEKDAKVREFRDRMAKFFDNFSDFITEFSIERSLWVEKFANNSVVWDLKFLHPKGGEGFIRLGKGFYDMVSISGYWYLEDINEDKRYIKTTASINVSFAPKELLNEYLSRELATVVSWERGDWSSVVNNFRRNMAPSFKKEYLNKSERLSEPTITYPLTNLRVNTNYVVIVCPACKHENEFKQPYPYSAGFGDQGFLYNDDGNLTLTWGHYDKMYMKLYPKEHPTGVEGEKKFEDMLLPAPHGGRWRFSNPGRCLKCSEKICPPMMSHSPYLLYEGSVETEKLENGFAGVLRKDNQ